jgi:hypothetical protein
VYTKYHSSQSLFTQLNLHSITVILIFTIFSFFFLQNTLQDSGGSVPDYFEDYCTMANWNSVLKVNPSHSMTQRLVGIYFLRIDAKL